MMGDFTLYLGAFALIIFLAVLVLEFSKPKKPNRFEEQKASDSEIKVYFNRELASEERLPADYETTEKLIALQARINGVQQKAEMAHSRIDDLEKEIVLSKGQQVPEQSIQAGTSGVDLTLIEERLGKLDSFSSRTEKEIKALKEVIAGEISSRNPARYSSIEEQRKKDQEFLNSVIFAQRKKR